MTTQHKRWTLLDLRGRCLVTLSECWEWRLADRTVPTSEHARAYPNVQHDGENIQVRRLTWQLVTGREVPEGMNVVPVKCSNPRCVNPWHNKPVTAAEKGQRAAAEGAFSTPHRRQACAEARRRSAVVVLDMDKARAIRGMTGPAHENCRQFGISASMFNRVRSGKAWREAF